MSKNIAVVFPGIGYHCDKPLLYYSKKVATKNNFEIIEVKYDLSSISGSIKNNREKTEDAIELAFNQVVEQLKEIDFTSYKEIVFIGKSIGTAVAARYNSTFQIDADQIVYTPIPETFIYLESCEGLMFHGSDDPFCDTKFFVDAADALSLTYAVIPEANHSLETGNVAVDIDNLGIIIKSVDKLLAAIDKSILL